MRVRWGLYTCTEMECVCAYRNVWTHLLDVLVPLEDAAALAFWLGREGGVDDDAGQGRGVLVGLEGRRVPFKTTTPKGNESVHGGVGAEEECPLLPCVRVLFQASSNSLFHPSSKSHLSVRFCRVCPPHPHSLASRICRVSMAWRSLPCISSLFHALVRSGFRARRSRARTSSLPRLLRFRRRCCVWGHGGGHV